MKKTVITSFALPRIIHEAFQEYAEEEGKTPSRVLRDWVSNAVGIPIETEETIVQKIDALLKMESVYPETAGKYPSKRFIYKAFQEDRIQYRDDGSVLLYSRQKKSCYCFVPCTLKD